MLDTTKYKDYRFTDDFNCADFARMVASDNGIHYPIGGVNHNSNSVVAGAIAENRTAFERVNEPRDFDLIYMKESGGRRHIGLYFNRGKIYHLKRDGSPVFQKITAELKGSIIGFYRLKDIDNA